MYTSKNTEFDNNWQNVKNETWRKQNPKMFAINEMNTKKNSASITIRY